VIGSAGGERLEIRAGELKVAATPGAAADAWRSLSARMAH
jgi:hypothetical protein